MSKKGQAALEFMMTYGWAILVVLAAIGALSYFGVLDPSRFTPNTCMASSGFSCDGKPIGAVDNLVFTISNGMGFNIPSLDGSTATLSASLASNCLGPVYVCPRGTMDCTDPSQIFEDGTSLTINISGCNFSKLNIVKGDITFNYPNAKSGLPEQLKVTLVTKP